MKNIFNIGDAGVYQNEFLHFKEVIKINYVLIPKEIIYETKMDKHRVIAYLYFATKRSLDNTVGFSCDSFVKWCGYTPNYNSDKTNAKFTNTLISLRDMGYIKIKEINARNTYNMAEVNIEKFDLPTQFALIYIDEIERIRDFKKYTEDTVKMSSSILLLLLSYIRVNMLRRNKDYIGKMQDKPEFCYRMYIDIEKDIGLSSRYLSRAIKILVEMDLIATHTLPRYKDDFGNWHTDVTLFSNKYKRIDGGESLDINYSYKQELLWGIEYIQQKKFLSKKFNQDL